MIIYAFDERWPNKNYAMTPHHERLAPYGGFIRKFIFNKHWDIQSVVNAIEIACDVNGSAIELLRICAHGNSGMVKIGKGLDINNVNQFRSLKGKFESLNSSGKGIEIHACGVASSTNIWNSKKQQCVGGSIGVPAKGLLFINALAKAADTKVVAGINCQYTDNQFHFEIPWTAAYP